MVASGPGISITGGHGDLNNFSPETSVTLFPAERNFQIADRPDQMRHVVRAQVKYGVDVIKILATGGVLSQGDSPGAPQFTYEELKVAADEAHMAGRKIAAHAHGAEGIKNAILAGIDSIEHASLATDEDIQLASNTVLISTWTFTTTTTCWQGDRVWAAAGKHRQRENGRPGSARDVSESGERWREDGVWNGCRSVSPRRQCEAVRDHGEIWDDAGTGDSYRHAKFGRSDWTIEGCGHD